MKTLKRTLSLVLILTLCLALGACGEGKKTDVLTIGVLQYASHSSLDNCYEGIVSGLEEAGYVDGENIKIEFQNAVGENENCDMMAKSMVAGQYDMIIAIATPAAMSVYSAAKDTDIPVIFSAVSDPVEAGLAQSLEAPGTGASGTADALNLEGQMRMIRAFLPEADTIGVLYTTSEPNSLTHLAAFEELAPSYGFTIEAVGITDGSEVASGAAALVAKGVDCVNNFTDNNVVQNLSLLLNATGQAGIPVFGSEEEQVINGCVASESLDYIALGRQTGQMAADVLSGKADIQSLPIGVVQESQPVYSQKTLDQFSLTLPPEYQAATNLD